MSSGSSAVGNEDRDSLADAWQRIGWANVDGQNFSDLSRTYASAYGIRVEKLNGDWWEASFHRFMDPQREAELFSELAHSLGSFLDHSRAALNYATYQLALLAVRQDPALKGQFRPDTVEFPIFREPSGFKRRNRMKKLPDQQRAAVEDVQPYDGRYPGLWLLHELAREYRHRVIHPGVVWAKPSLHRVIVNGQPLPAAAVEVVQLERLEHGSVVLRFNTTADANANVDPQVAITVGIDHPLCHGQIGTALLNQIRADVETVLNRIEQQFFS